MVVLACLSSFLALLLGFILSVVACSETDPASGRPLVVLLFAASLLVIQAILWVRVGTLL